jgi:ribosomal protein L7/L12
MSEEDKNKLDDIINSAEATMFSEIEELEIEENEVSDIDENSLYTFKKKVKTVENSREELEDALINSLLDVMLDSKTDQKLKAINSVITILGLKEEKVRPIQGENVQINIDKNSDVSNALMKSLTGIENVVEGSANEIKTQAGGKGA